MSLLFMGGAIPPYTYIFTGYVATIIIFEGDLPLRDSAE